MYIGELAQFSKNVKRKNIPDFAFNEIVVD